MPFSLARCARSLPTAARVPTLPLPSTSAFTSSRLQAGTVAPLLALGRHRPEKPRQARPRLRARDAVPDAIAADLPPLVLVVLSARHYADPAAFPAFRRMYSPSYFTPLPLYGSGGRKPRISAATWPTCALFAPLIVRRVGFSTLIVMPSGDMKTTGCEKPSCSTSFLPSMAARPET